MSDTPLPDWQEPFYSRDYVANLTMTMDGLQQDLDAERAGGMQLREVMGFQATKIEDLTDRIGQLQDNCSNWQRALTARNITYENLLAAVRKHIVDNDYEHDDSFVLEMIEYGMKPFERPVTVRFDVSLAVEVILEGVPTELTDEQVRDEIRRIIDIDPDWASSHARLASRVRMSDRLNEAGCTVEDFRTDNIDITSVRTES